MNPRKPKKPRKTITPIVDTNKQCVWPNIPLSNHRDSTNNHPEVGKVAYQFGKYYRTIIAWSQGRG